MNRRKPKNHRGPTWERLKDQGLLTERHVLLAKELGFGAAEIEGLFRESEPEEDALLLEWIEDLAFERLGRYHPVDENATPDGQQEHPAEHSLMRDHLGQADFVPGSDDEPIDWHEEVERRIKENENMTPVSYGEIHEEDMAMLRRQSGFRKAATLLAERLGKMEEVVSVVLFGSVALPLWKEVPRFSRLRRRRIMVYHECTNIDLAIRVTHAGRADSMRKVCSDLIRELVDHNIQLSIANHHFCLHLIDAGTKRYLGMVCHFNQCPKHKDPCRVPGCGATKFVQILPWFRFKPERLNPHNSLSLFDRGVCV